MWSGSGAASSGLRWSTGFAQMDCLRDEIVEYSDSVLELVATEAVDGRFDAVIEQFQPKQRHAIRMDRRTPKHVDLAPADGGEQNRRFWIVPQNG